MSEETTVPGMTDTTGVTTETTVTDNGQPTGETSYLDGKYKSISDLENGYRELQSSYSKKLGGFDGAPETYTLADGVESNATVEMLQQWGKENQMSQKGFDTFLDQYSKLSTVQAEAETKRVEEFRAAELQKLGENADYRVKNATDWVQANLGKQGIDVLNNLGGAEGIEVVEKIMAMTKGVTPTQAPAAILPDKDKIRAMRFEKDEFGNRRMSSDPEFRRKVESLEASLHSS